MTNTFREQIQALSNAVSPADDTGPSLVTAAVVIIATTGWNNDGTSITAYQVCDLGGYHEILGLLDYGRDRTLHSLHEETER